MIINNRNTNEKDALFYLNNIPIQVELDVLKVHRNNKYLPWNRKNLKYAISLTSVT